MANMRDIRRRIKGVKNTRQITKAMQLVAASKMKKAQDHALSGRPYALLLADMVDTLYNNGEATNSTFFKERTIKTRGVLVVGTEKGLCGALNSSIFRKVNTLEGDIKFISVGKKAKQYLSATKRDLIADFPISDKTPFSEVRTIVEFMLKSYSEGTIDSIEIVYTHYINTLSQEPELISILPLGDLTAMRAKLRERFGDGTTPPSDNREIIFDTPADQMIEELAALFIKQEAYQLILEAKASEHSARMVAMKSATDNASSLVDDLTLEYNRERQAAITQEILEISAAAAV